MKIINSRPIVALAATTLVILASCTVRSDDVVSEYYLCPLEGADPSSLAKQISLLASRHHANLFDRGGSAAEEIREIQKDGNGPNFSGDGALLLTVEKADQWRVSVTNLGLPKGAVMTIRQMNHSLPPEGFLPALGKEWKVLPRPVADKDDLGVPNCG